MSEFGSICFHTDLFNVVEILWRGIIERKFSQVLTSSLESKIDRHSRSLQPHPPPLGGPPGKQEELP